MKCPACAQPLTEMPVPGIMTVDVCEGGCGGIWFDNFELQKVDEKHETAGEMLLRVAQQQAAQQAAGTRRDCPRCSGIKMMRHFYAANCKVAVDHCGQCNGFWLDGGELAKIRAQSGSTQERLLAVERLYDQIYAEYYRSLKKSQQKRAT
jgi:uncharacterized protein